MAVFSGSHVVEDVARLESCPCPCRRLLIEKANDIGGAELFPALEQAFLNNIFNAGADAQYNPKWTSRPSQMHSLAVSQVTS
jgi:hypothetical protein